MCLDELHMKFTQDLGAIISEARHQPARSKTHLSKSATSRSFSKLSTKTTRSSDRFHKSGLNRCSGVEDGRHDGMQARCLKREFKIFPRLRNLVLSDYVIIA